MHGRVVFDKNTTGFQICLQSEQHWSKRLNLKRRNVVKVKPCLSPCPEAQTDLLTRGLGQDLVNSRGTERFHYSREVCLFFPFFFGFTIHGLVLQKTAQNALCGQLKLTNHIRLKSSSIKLSWITPCDSPLRIDKSTASRKKKNSQLEEGCITWHALKGKWAPRWHYKTNDLIMIMRSSWRYKKKKEQKKVNCFE